MKERKRDTTDSLAALRRIATVTGYILAFFGWLYFIITLLLIVAILLFPNLGADVTGGFYVSGLLLTPSWFLLRFGAGRWPFSGFR